MMNLPEKTRRFLPLALLLWVGSFVQLSAQNWQEYHVLNAGNYLSFQRSVLFNGNIVRSPDPAIGTLTTSVSGSTWTITFTPVPGAEGVAEFIIEYFPNQLPPAPKIEAFRVFVSTSFVDAQKDYAGVDENSVDNVLAVLENDVPHGSTELTVSHIAAVRNGSAAIAADGQSILFSPDQDFSGIAYLTYVVCDELGACANAEVDICVAPAEQSAGLDTIYLSTHSRASVIAFMPGPGFTVDNGPNNGSLAGVSEQTWKYTPYPDFAGTDVFTLSSETQTRHVIVDVYFKDAPNTFVNHDVIFTRVDETVTFNVLTNDVKSYPVDAYTSPEKGDLTFNGAGEFTYTPDSAYIGAQAFSYTTCFLSNCETGEVIVYVGDMIPENTETYDLVTTRNVPLVLNYEIPLEGYTFVIHAQPSSGELTLYNNYQSIDVLCSTVEGYDLLVYDPPADFTGSDYFELVYCIDGGDCHLVKVDVTVSDGEDMPCPCVDHCVWPGDADGSGKVDLNDVLSIGWQIGATGPEREYPDNTSWMGQNAEDWESEMWGMNSKYADSDGDGVIGATDIDAVGEYYQRKHTLVPQVTGLKADYQFDIIPLTEELDSGDLAVFEISIGSEANPVLDMHGVAFSLNLPMESIDSTTIAVEFYDNSWLGHDAPTVQLQKLPSGRVDAAFTRTSGKPATGIGIIGVMTFIITDDIEGIKSPNEKIPVTIGVNSVTGMASSGLLYDLQGNGGTAYITRTGNNGLALEQQVFVYPNPSQGSEVNVHVNGDRTLKQIDIYDLTGSLVASHGQLTEKHFSPTISNLRNGLYVLRITTSDGVVSKKFEVVRVQ